MPNTAVATPEAKKERIEKIYTLEQYLAKEAKSERKHEFHNGKIITMPGGTDLHSYLSGRIITLLNVALEEKEDLFFVHTSDLKIWVPAYNSVFYPDAFVIVKKSEYHNGRKDIITNPILIVEVLSPSTELFDRTDKFQAYKSIPSFCEYVLVAQDSAAVQRYFRTAPDTWELKDIEGIEKSVELKSIDVTLPLTKIYKNIDFEI